MWTGVSISVRTRLGWRCAADWRAVLQDGNNINNIMTVLPRDAHDNNVRERLLAPQGELCARPPALQGTAQSTFSAWGPGDDAADYTLSRPGSLRI